MVLCIASLCRIQYTCIYLMEGSAFPVRAHTVFNHWEPSKAPDLYRYFCMWGEGCEIGSVCLAAEPVPVDPIRCWSAQWKAERAASTLCGRFDNAPTIFCSWVAYASLRDGKQRCHTGEYMDHNTQCNIFSGRRPVFSWRTVSLSFLQEKATTAGMQLYKESSSKKLLDCHGRVENCQGSHLLTLLRSRLFMLVGRTDLSLLSKMAYCSH